MAVTEGYVQGPPDSTGKKIDTTTVTQTDLSTVHREGAVLVDAETLAARAKVRGDRPDFGDYALVVRIVQQNDELLEIGKQQLAALKAIVLQLAEVANQPTTVAEDMMI